MSDSKFPMVSLGDLLTRNNAWVEIEPDRLYKQVTVRLWGKGVVLRNEAIGVDIAASRRLVIKPLQFILSLIDARNGAFGLVPDTLNEAVVSPDFPTFNINTARILPSFLEWMSKTNSFINICASASKGTTNRIRLKEGLFLTTEIPLPPISEQQRIVGRIEELYGKVQLGRREQAQSQELINQLRFAYIASVIPQMMLDHKLIKFGSLIKRSRYLEPLLPEFTYHGIGTRMWGQGAYIHETKSGSEFNAERYGVRSGQLIYNEVWAHKGAIAIVDSTEDNIVVSRHFHVFDVDWDNLSPKFLTWIFRSPWFWNQCQDGSVGTSSRGHMRRQHLENILLPVPSLEEQHRIVAYLDNLQAKSNTLKLIQAQTTLELDSLLPSILDKAFRGEL